MFISETYSTNTLLKQRVAAGEQIPDLSFIRTDYQTAGRGQAGNSWESERGKNILMSILLKEPAIPAEKQFLLSELFPLAVIEAVEAIGGPLDIKVKWPNDIYVGNRKLAGILIENSLSSGRIDYAILGIGLNVNQTEWVSDAPNPVSLKMLTGHEWDVEKLTDSIMDRLRDRLEHVDDHLLHEQYMARLFRREGYHPYRNKEGDFWARIADVDAFGRLILEMQNGEKRTYLLKQVQYLL